VDTTELDFFSLSTYIVILCNNLDSLEKQAYFSVFMNKLFLKQPSLVNLKSMYLDANETGAPDGYDVLVGPDHGKG
jgi:hypothetical protein